MELRSATVTIVGSTSPVPILFGTPFDNACVAVIMLFDHGVTDAVDITPAGFSAPPSSSGGPVSYIATGY